MTVLERSATDLLAAFAQARASEGRWAAGTPAGSLDGVLITPTLPLSAFLAGRDGLPVGLQIVGPRYGDALVLRAARAYEDAHPEPTLAPSP